MENPRASVIVPVYNVEKYLAACLDSVLAQTLDSMEIICVDDGSTDSCAEILRVYAGRSERIRVIRQPNGGLSVARNTGIDAARGRYLLFLDSDDKLAEPGALEALCDRAEADELDLLFFEARVSYESEELRRHSSEPPDFYRRKSAYPACVDGQALYKLMDARDEYRSSACLYLSRRAFLLENKLRFPPGILHEDEAFTLEALALAKRASCVSLCGYDRLWREGSIMTQRGIYRRVHGNLLAARAMLDFASARLSGADADFLRRYTAHARAINLRGYSQYRKLSPRERRDFLEFVSPAERGAIRAQLRLAHRNWLARSVRLAVKRNVPEGLWAWLKALRNR